jgi:hypothetical protein
LQGFIINRDATGNPIVRTDKGDIPFTTNFFLKIGSEVVIRVGNSGGNALANLISVDGKSPEASQNVSAFSNEPEVILSPQLAKSLQAQASANTGNVGANTPNNPGVTVSGTVVSQPQATEPQTQALANGTQLSLKITSLTTPATSTAPQVPTTASQTAAQVSSSSYATYARAAAATTPAPSATTASEVTASITTPPTIQSNPLPAATTTPTNPLQAAPLPTTSTSSAGQPVSAATNQAPVTGLASAVTPPLGAQAEEVAAPTPQAVTSAPLPQVTSTTTIPSAVATPPFPQSSTADIAPENNAPNTTAPTSTQIPTPASPNTVVQKAQSSLYTATVIGNEASGEPLIQSPLGFIRLQASGQVPYGSQISFEVLEATPPNPLNIPNPIDAAKPAQITELAHQWNSLQQIFSLLTGRSTLTELDEQLTNQQATTNFTPQTTATGQTISSALLVFLSALKRNDFNNWLGYSNIRQLQSQGHDDLLKKAQGEFASLANQFTQSPPDQWQPLFFPIAVDGMLQQVRLFVKRDRKQNQQEEQRKEEDTRFVIEVDLTQLGELQMDGFVRKQDNKLQFDMVIRSLNGLSKEIQSDILRIYNDMGDITGYNGSITFQSVREFPVNPMQDIAASRDDVVV